MLRSLISHLVLADAPPCVAYKHNPCQYDSPEGVSVLLVLALIILVCVIVLGLLARRRRKRSRRARAAAAIGGEDQSR
ncbi:MAG: hypothetical protein ACLP01_10780 [Solirubrobacteraceae bacterium]